MTGRKQEFNIKLQQVGDGVLLMVAYWLAYFLRYLGTIYFGWSPIGVFAEFGWALFAIMPLGPLFLDLQGYYVQPLQKTVFKLLGCMARAGLILAVVLLGCDFFLKLKLPGRGAVLIFIVLAPVLLLLYYQIARSYFYRHGSENFRERVLLAGKPRDVQQFQKMLGADFHSDVDIVGEVNIDTLPVLELTKKLHEHSVGRVIFLGGRSHLDRVQEAIGACEVEGVEAWLLADFIHTSIAQVEVEMIQGRPLLVFRCTPALAWALIAKRGIDFIGALLLLLFTSPLWLIAAIGIRLTSPGSILFKQKRSGKHGRAFWMYKFRSMHTDAEMKQAELAAFNQMSGPVFKMERDPRITKFGKFLRKTSIDELPQLINVLRGEMSLVGPRPLPLYEVEKFESTAHRRRLSVKPGLTCLWQIKGRNRVVDFHEWVELDLQYIDNWTLWLDIKILAQTVPAVLFGSGAK